MTLAHEAEIKLKKYEDLHDNDANLCSLHSEVLTVQGQSSQPRDVQNTKQLQGVTVPRLN